MTLLIQQELRIPATEREQLEEHGRTGAWPALLHLGAEMLAFGRWELGGHADVVVTNSAYVDFAHWDATRPDGALMRNEALLAEIGDYVSGHEEWHRLVAEHALTTRAYELNDSASRPKPYQRRAGQRLPDPPPSFGRGSVISERTLAIADGQREEFVRLSRDLVWPWLEQQGGRLIGIGHDLMGPSNEVTTWFAFTSMTEWYNFARPSTANAPSEVVNAYTARANLVRHQRGRVMVVESDWGAGSPAA